MQILGGMTTLPRLQDGGGGNWIGFPFVPPEASSMASRVDALYFFLTALSGFLTLMIVAFIVYFGIRYRRGSKAGRHMDHSPQAQRRHLWLEITWSVIPLIIVILIFVWSAVLFFQMRTPPPGAMNIAVVAKQWMWKFQHPDGRREIDVLHVPTGRDIKLTMTSQDVIHSFYVPAFRIKQDVLPDRYTVVWFRPTRPGTYHLFCAEYCGTNHSLMRGAVVAMEPTEYERWLRTGGENQSLARQGEQLFVRHGCTGCHMPAPTMPRVAPALDGLYGSTVRLADGRTAVADRQYIHDSIVLPQRDIVAGFQPIMPTFQGVLDEEQILALVEYIRSLAGGEQTFTEAQQ